jgi:hypothetical protein
MQIQHGNMWDAWSEADFWLFTGNGKLTRHHGELVMGAGIAKQVKEKFPQQNLPKN